MSRPVTRPQPRVRRARATTLARAAALALLATLGGTALTLAPVAPAGPFAVRPAAAAEPDDGLSLVSDSTYSLLSDEGLVHVSVATTARNTKPNLVRETPTGSVTTRYFFESASIAIQAEATDITASAGGRALRTRVTPDDGFSVLRVDFPSDLYFDQSVSYTVDFD